jgi:SAM-dependent methyltransferase
MGGRVRKSLPEPVAVQRSSFSEVFAEALRGRPCSVVGLAERPEVLPVHEWRREPDRADLALLAHCRGNTVDLGCGPGRLTAALAALGHVALGVDLVPEAVDQAVARGAAALRRNVFDRLPGEGRWDTALLADGNVGIGGDPVALLRRAGELVSADGRVVVELAPPGVRHRAGWAALHCAGLRSAPFRWATVGTDDIHEVAVHAGFDRVEVHPVGGVRWCAVLHTQDHPAPRRRQAAERPGRHGTSVRIDG